MENFGFQKVNASEKEGLVRNVFNSVNNNYDIMNDLMSFGTHRIWKNIMVEWLAPRPSWKIIDVAGGTGDIAFRILDKAWKDFPGGKFSSLFYLCIFKFRTICKNHWEN